ncbi:MAG: PTS sugar transporter subunit IIA [Treponema sp.]|nr:PTS sugar transporter subunit IIA [Treponema sp.]
MFLHEVFPVKLIKIGLESEDKDEVFEEMTDLFCQGEKSDIRKNLLEALWERENKMSTGIQKGIAIPHGKTNALSDVYGILGISKKGIDYDALDDQPVYLLFMLLGPHSESEKHLRLLKRLAGLLDNPKFYNELVVQTDSQAAHGVIKKYEELFISSY